MATRRDRGRRRTLILTGRRGRRAAAVRSCPLRLPDRPYVDLLPERRARDDVEIGRDDDQAGPPPTPGTDPPRLPNEDRLGHGLIAFPFLVSTTPGAECSFRIVPNRACSSFKYLDRQCPSGICSN